MNTAHDATLQLDYDDWSKNDDGLIAQSSAHATIVDFVELLDVKPGYSVLEIGTGTGYSGALLSLMAGPDGRVETMDVVPELVDRASKRYAKKGFDNVRAHCADGFAGYPAGSPYDRVVAWASAEVVSDAWVHQTRPGGALVVPVKYADVATARAMLRCDITDGRPTNGTLRRGGFIDMAAHVVTDFGLPVRHSDATHQLPDGEHAWLSASALRENPEHASATLAKFMTDAGTPTNWSVPQQHAQDFAAYVMATADNPGAICTVTDIGQGVITNTGAALVNRTGTVTTLGAPDAAQQFAELHTAWEQTGRPGLDSFTVSFHHQPDGWAVRASV